MRALILSVLCGTVMFCLASWGRTEVSGDDSLTRGKYIVENVALCIECHTPRNSKGDLDRTRLLEGAPIPVKSPYPNDRWAFQAPAIGGLPGFSQSEVAGLLSNGRRTSGRVPLSPMPPFRLSQEDAEAVAAYLATLR